MSCRPEKRKSSRTLVRWLGRGARVLGVLGAKPSPRRTNSQLRVRLRSGRRAARRAARCARRVLSKIFWAQPASRFAMLEHPVTSLWLLAVAVFAPFTAVYVPIEAILRVRGEHRCLEEDQKHQPPATAATRTGEAHASNFSLSRQSLGLARLRASASCLRFVPLATLEPGPA